MSHPLLSELRARIGQLQRRVALLGTNGSWVGEPDQAPAPEPPPGATEYSFVPDATAAAAGGLEAAHVPVELPRYEPAPPVT